MAPGLAVTRLRLTGFRNYDRLDLELGGRSAVLTGPNGAGKTNLLEAVSLLGPGRGLRRATLAELGRRPQDAGAPAPWAIRAEVAGPDGGLEIATGLDTTPAGAARRRVKLDGAEVPGPAALGERVAIVWLTPQMDRLFLEGAGGRRRFLDRLVFGLQPGHATHTAAYEQAMRERNRVLRQSPREAAWLAALEDRMATEGVAIAASRREVAQLLASTCRERRDGPFPWVDLALAGTVEAWLDEGLSALEAEDRLRDRLAANRTQDRDAGATRLGPHRSDLLARHGPKDVAAADASTGEQKALLIGLILAHAQVTRLRRGMPPVLLLDELAAHLDRSRRQALYGMVAELGLQAFMTGTDAELFHGVGPATQHYLVENGRLAPYSGV